MSKPAKYIHFDCQFQKQHKSQFEENESEDRISDMVQQSVSHVADQVVSLAQQIEEHPIDPMHAQHIDG
jgi:hypothetical protein